MTREQERPPALSSRLDQHVGEMLSQLGTPSVAGSSNSNAANGVSPVTKEDFGLNNPNRVQQIKDNGERLYRKDMGDQARAIHLTRSETEVAVEELIKKIQAELYDPANRRLCFYDGSKDFIPRGVFARILSPERVLRLVLGLSCFENNSDQEKRKVAQDICFGSSYSPPCLKVLGILIGMEYPNEIKDYMEDEMSDECLPLRGEFTQGPDAVTTADRFICQNANHTHKIVNGYQSFNKKESFMKWNRRLTAPYLKWQGPLHSHYQIEKGECLPFPSGMKRQLTAGDAKEYGMHIGRDDQTDQWRYGGFSEISKVKICDSHRELGKSGLRNRDGYYALKQLKSSSRWHFELELSSLLFATDQGGSEKHLIQLLATIEEYNPADGSSTFFLLFDWADGDLVEFWRLNPGLVRNEQHCPWMAEQFLGLAKALQVVHNDRIKNLKHLPKAMSDCDLYGRHGDIKAKNTLWFAGGSGSPLSVLTLADFGLGRLHTKVSRSKQNPNLLDKDGTYKAPEFDLPEGQGLVSPVSDVFSLGCVFLEHISWYLLGYEAVIKDFPDARMAPDAYSFSSDIFFSLITGPDGDKIPIIKPAVEEWIRKLREHTHCTCYIDQMLDLIENKMLEPDRKKRIRAWQLSKELEDRSLNIQGIHRIPQLNVVSEKYALQIHDMDWIEDTPDFSSRDLRAFTYGEGKATLLQKLHDQENAAKEVFYGDHPWNEKLKDTPEQFSEPGLHAILCGRAPEVFEGQAAPISYLPFTAQLWQRIARLWHVHRITTRTLARQVAYFSAASVSSTGVVPRKLCLTARMSAYQANDLALSVTFIPDSSSTYVVLYGCNNDQAEDFEKRFRAAGAASHHPLLMIGIFAELEWTRLVSIAEDFVDKFTLRSEILDNAFWNPEVDVTGHKSQEYLALCLRSRGLIDHIRSVKRQIVKILEQLDEINTWLLYAKDSSPREVQRVRNLGRIGEQIKRRLREIVDEYDDKIDECNMMSENLSLTMQILWNQIARHDSKINTQIAHVNTTIALETKRDNAQMRSIALLTMIYIPLSCVASVFSTSLFDFQATDSKKVVSSYFWVFVGVAVGLTVLTVLTWHFATNRDVKKEERRNSFALKDMSMV
ncbi:protein kinase [Paramyrothecium foliicola]|nr:protein kinase [Paramyrothecium foliicola]